MSARLSRATAVGLIAFGIALLVASAGQARIVHTEGDATSARQIGAGLLALTGLLLSAGGARLWRRPQLGMAFPFLCRIAFYRWLLAGWFAVFLILGFKYRGDPEARYLCRALCAAWLAVAISPLLWPQAAIGRCGRLVQTRTWRALDLVVGNLAIGLLLAEATLRIGVAFTGLDALWLDQANEYRLRPGVYSTGLRANSLGFADTEFQREKRPGVPRVAVLGDSFSVNVRVPYEENYLTRLETLLSGVEVYNFGVSGTGPREYHTLLSTLVWYYEPDLIVVPIFIGNDITEWIPTPELSKFHPDALYVEALGRRLYRLAREQWRLADSPAAGTVWDNVPPVFSEQTYLEISAGRLVVCRKQETATDRRRWELTFTYLRRLLADCRSRQVPVAVLLLPDEFQVNPDLRRRGLAHRGWTADDVDLLMPQRRLREFCAAEQVPCLDLYPALAEARGAAYIPNDSHWNVTGNRLAAGTVAAWLRQQFPALLLRTNQRETAKPAGPMT